MEKYIYVMFQNGMSHKKENEKENIYLVRLDCNMKETSI